jgi:hypothetical protein
MAFDAHTALVHADGGTPDLTELVSELADRTGSGFVFGGLSSSRSTAVQFAVSADGNGERPGGCQWRLQRRASAVWLLVLVST